ncbi:unnamed protein product, partial [Mycena citricolor]
PDVSRLLTYWAVLPSIVVCLSTGFPCFCFPIRLGIYDVCHDCTQVSAIHVHGTGQDTRHDSFSQGRCILVPCYLTCVYHRADSVAQWQSKSG